MTDVKPGGNLLTTHTGMENTMAHTIIIAEDHPLFRTALQSALKQLLGDDVRIIETDTIAALQQSLEDIPNPDLILLDFHIPGAHGFSALLFLVGHYPDIPVLIISAREEETIILKAIGYGASGFIPKSTPLDTMKSAIQHVLDGNIWTPAHIDLNQDTDRISSEMEKRIASLTPQQFRVLGMISEGLLNKQIAFDLNVSEATIKAHVTAIFKKLGVRSRTQAVIALQQLEVSHKEPDSHGDGETKTPDNADDTNDAPPSPAS